ncbi:MAG: tautomerase family protein [Pseudolabrys sp.]|jgi:4-oxalocrotonate tautomerase
MPFVRVAALAPSLRPEQISRLQTEITDLMERVLDKVGDLTSVLVEQPGAGSWSIGRAAMRSAVHVDATVTKGTNSDEQKARFIGDTMMLLKDVFGPDLNPASYVVVTEVPAQSWGYDGLTQESRRLRI